MNIRASWRSGYRAKIDADVAYVELHTILKENSGIITPESIIKKAKLKKSPLHNAFNWNDENAAQKYRLEQARSMSRSLNVTMAEMPDKQVQWLSVVTVAQKDNNPTRKVYKTIEDILQDPVERDELLSRAINEALSYRKKYHMLSELAQIFVAMDEFVENADSVISL